MPRLSLSKEQFRLTQTGKIFSVMDLSPGGMALRVFDRDDFQIFSVGARFQGNLNIRGVKHPLQAKVRHIAGEVVGCEFENLEKKVHAALSEFLDPSSLGKELRPIPVSERGALWYHGPSGTDLLLWRGADGKYRRFLLCTMGKYIQWEEGRSIMTGRSKPTAEHGEEWGIVRLDTMILDRDPNPDPAKLSVAKTLILSSNLPQELRKWFVRQLQG